MTIHLCTSMACASIPRGQHRWPSDPRSSLLPIVDDTQRGSPCKRRASVSDPEAGGDVDLGESPKVYLTHVEIHVRYLL
jgi:hypothetical protein